MLLGILHDLWSVNYLFKEKTLLMHSIDIMCIRSYMLYVLSLWCGAHCSYKYVYIFSSIVLLDTIHPGVYTVHVFQFTGREFSQEYLDMCSMKMFSQPHVPTSSRKEMGQRCQVNSGLQYFYFLFRFYVYLTALVIDNLAYLPHHPQGDKEIFHISHSSHQIKSILKIKKSSLWSLGLVWNVSQKSKYQMFWNILQIHYKLQALKVTIRHQANRFRCKIYN